MATLYYESSFAHHGIKGQKWGVRRYQDANGRLTAAGKARVKNGERSVNLSPAQQKQFVNALQKDILDNDLGSVPYRTNTAKKLANQIIDSNRDLKDTLSYYMDALSKERDFYTNDSAVLSAYYKRYGKKENLKTADEVFEQLDGTEKHELFLEHEFYSKVKKRSDAYDSIDEYENKVDDAYEVYEGRKLEYVYDDRKLTSCLGDQANRSLKTPNRYSSDIKWTPDRVLRHAIEDQMDNRLVKKGYW